MALLTYALPAPMLEPESNSLIAGENHARIDPQLSLLGQAVESELKGREALVVTFWAGFEDHEKSHRSETFQPLFEQVLELCENGNEEIA